MRRYCLEVESNSCMCEEVSVEEAVISEDQRILGVFLINGIGE